MNLQLGLFRYSCQNGDKFLSQSLSLHKLRVTIVICGGQVGNLMHQQPLIFFASNKNF